MAGAVTVRCQQSGLNPVVLGFASQIKRRTGCEGASQEVLHTRLVISGQGMSYSLLMECKLKAFR